MAGRRPNVSKSAQGRHLCAVPEPPADDDCPCFGSERVAPCRLLVGAAAERCSHWPRTSSAHCNAVLVRPTILIAESANFSATAVARLRAVGDVILSDLDRQGLLFMVKNADVLWVRLR